LKKVLLLGAGFSYDLGMPLAHELTDVFLSVLNKKNARLLVEAVYQANQNSGSRPINKKALNEAMQLVLDYKGHNYEELLASIEALKNIYSNKSQSDRDSYHHLFGALYSLIHMILNCYQQLSYAMIYPKNKQCFGNLGNLLSDEETWVFTLNHDMYLECLALDLGIPITYGDEHLITFPKSNLEMRTTINLTYSFRDKLTSVGGFLKNQKGINLVKLHGGLSELEYNDNQQLCNQSLNVPNSMELMLDFMNIQAMGYYANGKKVPSGRDRVITDLKGELDIICQSMLTGGGKYSITTNDKKGEEKLKLLTDQLKNTDELTIIGYGFGDKHINNRVSNSMVSNEKLKVRIVDAIHKPIPESLEQFNYDGRIRQSTCGAAHWMDYVENEVWNRDQMSMLEQNKHIRGDILRAVKRMLPF